MDLKNWAALDDQGVATMFALKKLVESFDNEDGLPKEVFEAAGYLLAAQLGIRASVNFSNVIDATDGRFYFKNSEDCQHVAREIFGE